MEEKTIKETFLSDGSNKYSTIRSHARRIALSMQNKCVVCGYSKHVDICHKKSIHKFPDTALVKEVNDKNNLVKLCRNHHWEFDHGLLSDEDKKLI